MLEKEKEQEETSFKKVFSNPKNDITWYQSIGLTLCFGLIYASIFGNPFATSKNEIDNAVTVIQSPVPSYLINTNQKKTYDMVISDFKNSVDGAFIITKNLDINKSEEELKKLIFQRKYTAIISLVKDNEDLKNSNLMKNLIVDKYSFIEKFKKEKIPFNQNSYNEMDC